MAGGDPGRPVFGNVMQAIDASAYRGKRVRFRGAVRVEAIAGLWMPVNRTANQSGFFQNMQARPIRASDRAHYEIKWPIDERHMASAGITAR